MVLEISFNLVKSFTSQRSTRDVPSLVLFEQPSSGGYISYGSVQVEGTSTWLFKENKGGYILYDSLLVKDFTRLLEISRTGGCLGTGCRHGLLPNQYKSCVCLLLPYTLYFSAVYFLFPLYFCLSYCFCSLLSHNLVVKPN